MTCPVCRKQITHWSLSVDEPPGIRCCIVEYGKHGRVRYVAETGKPLVGATGCLKEVEDVGKYIGELTATHPASSRIS